MKSLTVCMLIISLISCQTSYEQKSAIEVRIDEVFKDLNDSTPGCAVGIIQDGELMFSKGYGLADLEHNIPITPSTVFYIGSVSKQFVTFSLMLLEEEGRLSLDDPVSKYIPEFPDYGYPITLRHFIHHTSGVRDYLELWNLSGKDYLDYIPDSAVLELICRQKELNFEPGTKYLYSNSCYFILALVVERVSGMTMRQFGRQRVFKPLNMDRSRFHDDYLELIPDRAFSYNLNEDDKRWDFLISRFDLVGSGGIYSSINDLYKWDQNFSSNQLGGGSALIARMQEDGKFNDGTSIGYAAALDVGHYRGLRTVGHTGSLAGYRAAYLRFPDQNTSFVILSNFAQANPQERLLKLADFILQDDLKEMADIPERQDQETDESMTFEATSAAELGGRFYSEELDTFYDFSTRNNSLYLKIGYQPEMQGRQIANRTFQFGDWIRINWSVDGKSFILDAGRVKNLQFVRI